MKLFLNLFSIIFFSIVFFSCKKTIEDPLSAYSAYGIFKKIYLLQDSVTVDLSLGDSTFIETNKGKMWIKVLFLSVSCYKSIDATVGCTDLGNIIVYSIKNGNEKLEVKYIQEGFPVDSPLNKLPLTPCFFFTPINDRYIPKFTLGRANIVFRGIYPYPQTKKEQEEYNANNGKKLHVILTFQKICN